MQFMCDCGEVFQPEEITESGMLEECKYCGKIPTAIIKMNEEREFGRKYIPSILYV